MQVAADRRQNRRLSGADGTSRGQKTSLGVFALQVWDDELERSATHWAEQCQWDHGPQDLLRSIGQNLAVHWGR